MDNNLHSLCYAHTATTVHSFHSRCAECWLHWKYRLIILQSRRWFEFCFLPIIPFGSDHIWFCNICSESLSLRYYASLTQSRLASRQEFFHSNTGANALSSTIPAPVSATVLGSKSPCVGLGRHSFAIWSSKTRVMTASTNLKSHLRFILYFYKFFQAFFTLKFYQPFLLLARTVSFAAAPKYLLIKHSVHLSMSIVRESAYYSNECLAPL